MPIRFTTLLLALALIPAWPRHAAAQAPAPWRTYDVDRNGRFDQDDINAVMKAGERGQPSKDANGDGKKDGNDLWAMMGLLTRWDEDASGFADAADALRPGALRLPGAVTDAMVREIAQRSEAAHEPEPGAADRLALMLSPTWKPAAADGMPAVHHDTLGAAAMILGDLDLAEWHYASAVLLDASRPTALTNLAFVLLQRGRNADALTLLARALDAGATACAVHANIATAFAQERQQGEALRHYRKAAADCPTVGQYHLNVGAALLRMDSTTAALAAFRQAEKLDDANLEALLMVWSIAPPPLPAMAQVRRSWDAERQKAAATIAQEGLDPATNPYGAWEQADAWERARFILQDAGSKVAAQHDLAAETVRHETQQTVERLLEPFRFTGANCGQLQKAAARLPETMATIQDVNARAVDRLRILDEHYQRKTIAYQLSMDPLILALALEDGQRRLAAEGQAGFMDSIEQYRMMMEDVRQGMNDVESSIMFLQSDPDEVTEEVGLGMVANMLELLEKDAKCNIDGRERSGNEPELEFGADVGLAGISYKPKTCEVKIRAGQGLMVAGTWSPRQGFGFEPGVGADLQLGPFSFSAAKYYRHGSDGSFSVTEEFGGGVAGLPGTHTIGSTKELSAATHAPVGASAWLADYMGCK